MSTTEIVEENKGVSVCCESASRRDLGIDGRKAVLGLEDGILRWTQLSPPGLYGANHTSSPRLCETIDRADLT